MGGIISKSENYKTTRMDNGSFVFGIFVPVVALTIVGLVIILSKVFA